MGNIMDWLLQSNRWKHLLGGFIVGLIPCDALSGVYATLVGASCLEFKDKTHGGEWDWIDWGCTAVGGLVGALITGLW